MWTLGVVTRYGNCHWKILAHRYLPHTSCATAWPAPGKVMVRCLLELKKSNLQPDWLPHSFHNINCAKDKRGRKNLYYAKFLPPGEKKQRIRMLPGSMSATAEGAADQAGLVRGDAAGAASR
jgi:hypothetical protein